MAALIPPGTVMINFRYMDGGNQTVNLGLSELIGDIRRRLGVSMSHRNALQQNSRSSHSARLCVRGPCVQAAKLICGGNALPDDVTVEHAGIVGGSGEQLAGNRSQHSTRCVEGFLLRSTVGNAPNLILGYAIVFCSGAHYDAAPIARRCGRRKDQGVVQALQRRVPHATVRQGRAPCLHSRQTAGRQI